MNTSPTPSPLPVGYSTYRSKRHSRASSANVVPTEQSLNDQDLPEKLAHQLVESTSTLKLNGASTGFVTPALSFGSPASNRSLPTPPLNGKFGPEPPTPSPSIRAVSPIHDGGRTQSVSPFQLGPPTEVTAAELEPIDETAPSPSTDVAKASPTGDKAITPVTIEVTGPPPIPDSSTKAELEKPLPVSPSSSVSSQAALKPPLRSAGSTFRRLQTRTTKSVAPSPLRPSSSVRTFSGGSSASGRAPSVASTTSSRVLPSSQSQPIAPLSDGLPTRPSSQLSGTQYSEPPSSQAVSRVTSPAATPISSPPFPDVTQSGLAIASSSKPSFTTSPSISTQTPLPYEPRQSLPSTPSVGPSTANRQIGTPPPKSSIIAPSKPALAPYRPGFQPKGVCSPRTDEFIALRAGRTESRKAEEKRLLRRLEKLTDLHFAPQSSTPTSTRRSSFLDFSELRSKSAADLWKDVVDSASPAARNERQIRETEQSITRWEDDKAVTACRICDQSFHPLTNRKHHCRLCGRIVCSLPPRPPHRMQRCSLLISVDPRTGRVEEIPDIIAYGVARRDTPTAPSPRSPTPGTSKENESKGVRVCHDCFNVVMRKQFTSESSYVPPYARLHRAMLRVEQQLQEVLPQFQELILSAADGEIHMDRNATQTRKDVLEMFAQYDTIAKKIKSLPTVPGSSQERVQSAITTRASMFLQQHMLPLKRLMNNRQRQSLSSQVSSASSDVTSSPDPLTPNGLGGPIFRLPDSDATLAHSLQPLLEQEALLESYVEEAMQARKFEDAQTLKSNLDEIRSEIARMTKDATARPRGR